jgi:hypothetical protein
MRLLESRIASCIPTTAGTPADSIASATLFADSPADPVWHADNTTSRVDAPSIQLATSAP